MTVIERELAPVAAPRRRGTWIVVWIGLATFGPYVGGGLRTEQIVVYGLLLLALPFKFQRLRCVVGGLWFMLPWTLYIGVATLSLLLPSGKPAPHPAGDVFAGYDNILSPVALMLLIWAVIPAQDGRTALVAFCKIVASATAVNGAIAIAGTAVNFDPILQLFWTGGEGESVAQRAAQLGRLGGIFNQPSEAGTMYGLAGLAAVYGWGRTRPVVLMLALTLITIGGLLTVSKIFIFGGLPLLIVYWLWNQQARRRSATIGAAVLGAGGLMQSGIFDQWIGTNYLLRLLNPSGGYIDFYSAGRFSDRSSFSTAVSDALEHSPLAGVGPGGWRAPYDGAVAEALVVAGLIGLACYAFVVVAILKLSRRNGEEGRLALFLAAIVFVGALGFSPLTANRVSTVIWVMISLLVLTAQSQTWTDLGDLQDHEERNAIREPL